MSVRSWLYALRQDGGILVGFNDNNNNGNDDGIKTFRVPSDLYIRRKKTASGFRADVCIRSRHSPNFPASTFSRGYSIVRQSES